MKKKTKIIIAILVILALIIGIIVGIISYVNSCLKPTKEFLNGEICNEYDLWNCRYGSYIDYNR